MAQIKHRPFNADRFLDKFRGNEAALTAYLGLWDGLIPGLPEPFEVDAFKDFLKTPPEDCRPFEEMVEGLYQAYDLCTPQGDELMHEAAETNRSPLAAVHDVPREIFALRLRTEDQVSFELASNLLTVLHVDQFATFKGKEARAVEDVDAVVEALKAELQSLFSDRKGSDKVLVKYFADGDILNFIIYHEERVKAEIQLQEDGTTLTVQPLIFRPARQDFISYFPDEGKIQIDNPSEKERESMRKAFGEVCLGDAEFFEEEGSDATVDLSALASPDFDFQLDDGDTAKLTEIIYKLPQQHAPTFSIRSKDAFATLEMNGMRAALEDADIQSAKIKLVLPGNRRGKTITLKPPNRLSFNRSTQADRVMDYLSRWNLVEE
jgi:hypothetical protein